jgi:hypothetical protein
MSGNRSAGISICRGGYDSVSSGLRPWRGCPRANFYSGCVPPGLRPGKIPRLAHDPLQVAAPAVEVIDGHFKGRPVTWL